MSRHPDAVITPNTALSDARRRLKSPLRPGQRMPGDVGPRQDRRSHMDHASARAPSRVGEPSDALSVDRPGLTRLGALLAC